MKEVTPDKLSEQASKLFSQALSLRNKAMWKKVNKKERSRRMTDLIRKRWAVDNTPKA
jgi:hypothetical protein